MVESIIIGFIFGLIIFYFSIKRHGPNSNEFRQRIFRKDNKCYKFFPKIYICPSSISSV